jgi:exosortase
MGHRNAPCFPGTHWPKDRQPLQSALPMEARCVILRRQALGRMNPISENAVGPETPPEAPISRSGWWQGAILAALVGFLYYHIAGRLVYDWWNDPNFSHGFLIPLFSAFLVWQQRKQLARLRPNPSWFGLAVIAGSLMILIVGVLGAELFLSRSSLVFLLAGLVVYFLGWSYFRATIFPWAFLFLMIPIPAIIFNQIAFPLQLLASRLASALLELMGVPVLREGNVIQLPAMLLEVAEACSGIRSLMSLVALAVIYGYFLEPKLLRRVLLALAAIPVAVIANSLRVVGTGLLVHWWDPEKAEGFFHTFSGWVIFVLSLGMLFALHGAMGLVERYRTGRKP